MHWSRLLRSPEIHTVFRTQQLSWVAIDSLGHVDCSKLHESCLLLRCIPITLPPSSSRPTYPTIEACNRSFEISRWCWPLFSSWPGLPQLDTHRDWTWEIRWRSCGLFYASNKVVRGYQEAHAWQVVRFIASLKAIWFCITKRSPADKICLDSFGKSMPSQTQDISRMIRLCCALRASRQLFGARSLTWRRGVLCKVCREAKEFLFLKFIL